MTRIELLEALLAARTPLAPLAEGLARFGWDSPPLVVLRRAHVVSVLQRFLSGELGGSDVREWAELIEVRDDIEFEPVDHEVLRDALFTLATPDAQGQLDAGLVASLIGQMTGKP
ncbi:MULTISPECIES: hypothetical protein [unclassified Anaeromyxobacter]|uniref:hypothetical protein n=1 Tax=unclassified Anaeromyxobacter TaxID=2620896 RepID=UPI001F57B678|nr:MULTISPECIES: hypothetical protein [unclassified Anaeromyxobacter]